MKKNLVLVILVSVAFVSQAQTAQGLGSDKPIGKFVGEVNVGTGFPLFKVGTDGTMPLPGRVIAWAGALSFRERRTYGR